jgi:GNAT superfamily N-acetyltransferase
MSKFILEPLGRQHDRAGFRCGVESLDRYLRETARGHDKKQISRTRVLVGCSASPPKPILGYFTLTQISVDARDWPGAQRGLPRLPVAAVLLGRLAVARSMQNKGISRMLVASAAQIALQAIDLCGGIGLAVDAENETLIAFYRKFGFRRIGAHSLRLFLPTEGLRVQAVIPEKNRHPDPDL